MFARSISRERETVSWELVLGMLELRRGFDASSFASLCPSQLPCNKAGKVLQKFGPEYATQNARPIGTPDQIDDFQAKGFYFHFIGVPAMHTSTKQHPELRQDQKPRFHC